MYTGIMAFALIVFSIERYLHNRRIKKYDKKEFERRSKLNIQKLKEELGEIKKQNNPSGFIEEMSAENFKKIDSIINSIKDEKVKENALKARQILFDNHKKGLFTNGLIERLARTLELRSM